MPTLGRVKMRTAAILTLLVLAACSAQTGCTKVIVVNGEVSPTVVRQAQ